MTIWDKLAVPFLPSQLRWRVGSVTKKKDKATALAYIDARDLMDRLDAICGVDGWKDEYITESPRTIRKKKWDKNASSFDMWNEQVCGRVICKLSILDRNNNIWITKCDGAGETNVEGEKGGISDAFKRAAVKFGVNRDCYRIEKQYVPIDDWKNFTQTPKVPKWYMDKIEKYKQAVKKENDAKSKNE
jgi:hypothetical protein